MRKFYTLGATFFLALLTYGQSYHALSGSSFSQNWSNTGLITANDTWSGVPSIIGFLGQGLTASTGVNPQTVLAVSAEANDVDVIANQTNPGGLASGGVAEFELANPTIALQGSGTADAPYITIYLNTTGTTGVRVRYTVRDVDGSADNATQQVALQYRIGNTGNFVNVPAAYIADATTGGSATQETLVDVTLPAAADNQAELQVRIITTNAVGNDEWVGIDDINISGTSAGGDVTAPTVSSVSPADNTANVAINATATINFSETVQKGTGNITVRRAADDVAVQTLDVTTPQVSLSGNQVSFALALANSTDYYITVDAIAFEDLAGNDFAGILDKTTWNFTTVAPPADGVLGTTYTFNTCGNLINEGFKTYSVTGPQGWTCSKFGRTYTTDPSLDSALEMNGFASGAQANEDWLISPKFDLSGTDVPLLDFYTLTRFAGPALSLRISTNYAGTGDPSLANWVTLNGFFPSENSNTWTLSDSINLSLFKTSNVHLAWVYTSTTAAASRWTIDDIRVYNSTVAPTPSLSTQAGLLNFRQVEVGFSSAERTFLFYGNNLSSDLTITAPAGFEVSRDGSNYSASISFTAAETTNGQQGVFVRFSPSATNTVYAGQLRFTATGLDTMAVTLQGNSYPLATTLNVVNWNIEWFGSTGNGPSDENLQQANAKKVMDALDADVYAVAEIVDENRLASLVGSLASPYSYVVANYCSGGTSLGACATSQKLAFVYKTGVLANVSARPMLLSSAAAVTNWANGRVPFLVTADVSKNGQTSTVNFIVVHAKANTGNTAAQIESYGERKAGVQELKDSLDTYFPTANVILLGDFNDDLDRTIAPTTGADTVSSYQPLVADSTDGNHYRSLTLPLSYAKLSSTATNPEMIDHVVVSDELASRYINLSASLYNDIATIAGITDYPGTTSDHYPVMTRFLFGGTLPVKLVSFTATKENTGVRLTWTTAQEVNTRAFAIERSANGASFERIALVAASGQNNLGATYQVLDARPVTGTNFYRLRSLDADGKAELSKVIKINVSLAFTVSLSPNPASSLLTLTITNRQGPLTLQVVDMSGKVVKSTLLTDTVNTIPVSDLAKGFYLVKVVGGSHAYTEKLLID